MPVQAVPRPVPVLRPARLAGGHRFKSPLLGGRPPSCRRVLVRGDSTLAELHHFFQVMMGWENWPLHQFQLWGKAYGNSCAGGTYAQVLKSA